MIDGDHTHVDPPASYSASQEGQRSRRRWPLLLVGAVVAILIITAVVLIPVLIVRSRSRSEEDDLDETKFEVKGKELHMNGEITSNTFKQFTKIMEENPGITTLVELNVPGSSDDFINLVLGVDIRERKLNTRLLSTSDIASGGTDLFLAGVERTMQDGARIGVHSWSDGKGLEAKELPRISSKHKMYVDYTKLMLGDEDFYWFTIQAAPADGMHTMTKKEISKYRLLTGPIE